MAAGADEIHGIIIVGGGICGLATALALHRKGISSLVLERAETLRATGAGIGIQVNGWRALDQLEVGNELRKLAMPLSGSACRMDKRDIHDSSRAIKVPIRTEFRCLKRSDLLETLAKHLPVGSIRFGCQVEAISLEPITRFPVVSGNDGTSIKAKHAVFAIYPEGHNFANRFQQLIGDGVNFRLIPIDDKIVSFNAIHLQPSKADCSTISRNMELIQLVTLQRMQGFPEEIIDLVRHCDTASLSFTQFCYRAPWHMAFETFQQGTVTVAGDAMHVMGSFLGQGGACGLEDTVVLARCLARTTMSEGVNHSGDDRKLGKSIENGLRLYVKERRWRILMLSFQTFLMGVLVAASSGFKKVLATTVLAVLFRSNCKPKEHTRNSRTPLTRAVPTPGPTHSHWKSWAEWIVEAQARLRRGRSTRRGLSIHVTDRAVTRRALVQHSAAFLDRPATSVPSTILTRSRHHNVLSAPYGPYWRAVRGHVAAGALHPSRLGQLGDLVRALRSGAPAGESLHFAVFSVIAEMCFGEDVVYELGEARLRAILRFQRDLLLALPSFWVFVKYPRIGRLLYTSRWRQLLALRRQQEVSFLPLVAEVRNRKTKARHGSTFTAYVESLRELRVHEDGDRAVTDGELVSLISEFLGAGTESTASALEWTMDNLVKHPEPQRKLRLEVDAVVGSSRDRTVEAADLSRMPYLKAVVLERLRRHPPVPFVLRHVRGRDADAAAGALGVPRLPGGGATVNFLVGKIGRDPAAMMPFGAGRRICPGLAPVVFYLEYFVANLAREFERWEADGEEVDLAEFHGSFFTLMDRPLRARLVPQDAAAAAAARPAK
ncbi:cytochrome P450 89A2-like [Panicum miliaceum]|uniref:Cytochrome P450 89A2-like n=1 Tax=Panicum miliaceum TaxID=4540 RepID=A0A3L6PXJ2_PANMI|nr:cytochrome P450 89A2-like [Panicum miliaceum]